MTVALPAAIERVPVSGHPASRQDAIRAAARFVGGSVLDLKDSLVPGLDKPGTVHKSKGYYDMSGLSKSYTPEELRKQIQELGKNESWFHCVELGNDVKTREPVPHLQDLWARIQRHIPIDLSGKSVLDIGCNAGFFSVSAKQRNADYVLGIDMSPGFLKQAEFVRDVLGLDIEYKNMSIYDLPTLGRTFDIVLCLGVIYHCADPFKAAENVASVTAHTAIVESALLNSALLSDKPVWEFVFPGYERSTGVPGEKERHYNWWFPNMTGLRALFQRGLLNGSHVRDRRQRFNYLPQVAAMMGLGRSQSRRCRHHRSPRAVTSVAAIVSSVTAVTAIICFVRGVIGVVFRLGLVIIGVIVVLPIGA
jgi:tRNA (mo5U34)-methyltransferase